MRRMLSVSFLNEMPLYRDKYHSIVGLFDNRKKKYNQKTCSAQNVLMVG